MKPEPTAQHCINTALLWSFKRVGMAKLQKADMLKNTSTTTNAHPITTVVLQQARCASAAGAAHHE